MQDGMPPCIIQKQRETASQLWEFGSSPLEAAHILPFYCLLVMLIHGSATVPCHHERTAVPHGDPPLPPNNSCRTALMVPLKSWGTNIPRAATSIATVCIMLCIVFCFLQVKLSLNGVAFWTFQNPVLIFQASNDLRTASQTDLFASLRSQYMKHHTLPQIPEESIINRPPMNEEGKSFQGQLMEFFPLTYWHYHSPFMQLIRHIMDESHASKYAPKWWCRLIS